MFRKIFNKFKKMDDERGSILIISYFVVVLLAGLGAAFLTLSVNENKAAERQKISTVAFYIAEAGLERALYDLRQDFVNDSSSPSWSDGSINGYEVGPDTSTFYTIPYNNTTFNDGNYLVQAKNTGITGSDISLKSTGTYKGATAAIQVYVKMINISPWGNAIFAGAGASGQMVNGNVNIRGSVHILGTGLNQGDLAIDLGGTAELVGNNYSSCPASLIAKVPALPKVTFEGEAVETLGAELRVKTGVVGLSGSSTVGEVNIPGNAYKETVDGAYVTDGYGGNKGSISVYSDNGTTNGYDLGDSVKFPSLSDPHPDDPTKTFKQYFKDNALILTNELSSITPSSSFSYSNANGSISMDGNGNMTISGLVYIDSDNNFSINKSGSNTTINYTGKGSLLVTGNVSLNANMVTAGNNSFPNNIMGVMTPNNITLGASSQVDIMGVFYAENSVIATKQTDIMGTIVSNYFNMGTNVPAIFQVPETVNSMPPSMLGENAIWYMVVAWQKVAN